jgi:hypothetical protein
MTSSHNSRISAFESLSRVFGRIRRTLRRFAAIAHDINKLKITD